MVDYNNEKYPLSSLKPKHETNVTTFLAKNPKYDGTDVTIAILDSGVDPKASGLQVCNHILKYIDNFMNIKHLQILPNGEQKVIERFDCSGCGDVTTSTIVNDNDGIIVGLSGRKLKLSSFMKSNNISNEYRTGLKSLSDLYPSRVRDKILADSKLKEWDEKHKKATASIIRCLSEFDSKNSSKYDKITNYCLMFTHFEFF